MALNLKTTLDDTVTTVETKTIEETLECFFKHRSCSGNVLLLTGQVAEAATDKFVASVTKNGELVACICDDIAMEDLMEGLERWETYCCGVGWGQITPPKFGDYTTMVEAVDGYKEKFKSTKNITFGIFG